MQTDVPAKQSPRPTTNPTAALLNVLVTLGLFVVSFIGFLIAPWAVLAIAATLYACRMAYLKRKSGAPVPDSELDGAIEGFGLGGAQ